MSLDTEVLAPTAQAPSATSQFSSTLSPTGETLPGSEIDDGTSSRLRDAVPDALLPSITTMIRADHTHALATFHRYNDDLSDLRKKAIRDQLCLALEIHAQLEEEIFYPALQRVADGDEVLAKSKPEHDTMRRVIAQLRATEPGDARFGGLMNELMRDVMHHVADEETVLLPLAEARLAGLLGQLGARMTRRRLQLVRPHTLAIARNTALVHPAATALFGAALGVAAWGITRALSSRD